MSTLPEPPSHGEIHANPEYKPLEDLLVDVIAAFSDVDPTITAQYINQVIPYEVLTHATQHHVRQIAPQFVEPALVKAAYLPLSRMFIDGFLAGAKLQGQRDAQFLGSITVPDDPADLDTA